MEYPDLNEAYEQYQRDRVSYLAGFSQVQSSALEEAYEELGQQPGGWPLSHSIL